jgi:peroxiredoxin
MKVLLLITVLASLAFSSGCENKQGIKIGDTPPEISCNDIHGKSISLSQFKGKVVVLYFWKSSCCGDILKMLQPFQSGSKDKGLAVLAVNVGDAKETVESYEKNYALTFTMLRDENSKLFNQYHLFGFPTIFILDKNGIVREKIQGDIQIERLEKLVVKQFKIQKEIEANYEKTHSR